MKKLSNSEIHALIAEEQRMDAIAHNLTNEERLHICDMGFYNTVISGYLIKAMENSSFGKADIARCLEGLRWAFDQITAAEADQKYQNF